MPNRDPSELDAEIEKAHREITELQQRIREREAKRKRVLKMAKGKATATGKTGE